VILTCSIVVIKIKKPKIQHIYLWWPDPFTGLQGTDNVPQSAKCIDEPLHMVLYFLLSCALQTRTIYTWISSSFLFKKSNVIHENKHWSSQRKNFWDSIRPSPGSRKFLAYVAKRDKQLLSSNFLKEIRKNCANLHKPQVIQIIHAIYIPA